MFSGNDWLEIQKQYLEAFRVFNQFLPGIKVKPDQSINPVRDTAEFWWKSVSQNLPAGSAEFVGKILEQGKIYYSLGEQFSRLLNDINKLDKSRSGWESLLGQQFEDLKTLFSKSDKEADETLHKMFGAWQLMPMDTLQRTFSLASIMPGDFLGDLKRDSLQKVTDKFLSMPGVGYTRESQEQVLEGIRLWNEYQTISHEYNQALYKVGIGAIDAMRDKILAMAKEDKELKSLRDIYDLWIDCNEESYASYVYTPEFSELYGRLTNALMAVKQHGRNLVDEYLGALNVPTYKGINTLQKRQYDMRREQKTTLRKIQDLEKVISDLEGRKHQATPTPTEIRKPVLSVVKSRSTGKQKMVVKNIARTRNRNKTTAAGKKTTKHMKNDNVIVIKL